METTKLSSKGQVIIPKGFRTAHHWETGLELVAIEVGEGILLKPKIPFEESKLDDVAGCLKFDGNAKSLNEIEASLKERFSKEFRTGLFRRFTLISQHCATLKTFDEHFIKRAKQQSQCKVEKP